MHSQFISRRLLLRSRTHSACLHPSALVQLNSNPTHAFPTAYSNLHFQAYPQQVKQTMLTEMCARTFNSRSQESTSAGASENAVDRSEEVRQIF